MKAASIFLAGLLYSGALFAMPVRINFNAVDYQGASDFNGGVEFLGLQNGDVVSGHIVVDDSNAENIDTTHTDRAQYPNTISEMQIGFILDTNPGYTYYYVNAAENLLQFYFNAFPSADYFDVFLVNLQLAPGLVTVGNFDFSLLNQPVIIESVFIAQRFLLPAPPLVATVYSGSLNVTGIHAVPEPSILPIFLIGGMMGLVLLNKKRKRRLGP